MVESSNPDEDVGDHLGARGADVDAMAFQVRENRLRLPYWDWYATVRSPQGVSESVGDGWESGGGLHIKRERVAAH